MANFISTAITMYTLVKAAIESIVETDWCQIVAETTSTVIQFLCTEIGAVIGGALTAALAIATVGGGAIAGPLIIGGCSPIGSGIGAIARGYVKDWINPK